jgi:hypothetical protein
MGIAPDRARNYCSDSVGTQLNFRAVSAAAASLRAEGALDDAWGEEVRQDFLRRG